MVVIRKEVVVSSFVTKVFKKVPQKWIFLTEPLLRLDMRGNEDLSEKEIRLIEMLTSVKRSCGDVCETNQKGKYSESRLMLSLVNVISR